MARSILSKLALVALCVCIGQSRDAQAVECTHCGDFYCLNEAADALDVDRAGPADASLAEGTEDEVPLEGEVASEAETAVPVPDLVKSTYQDGSGPFVMVHNVVAGAPQADPASPRHVYYAPSLGMKASRFATGLFRPPRKPF